jgi:hypothetical protein
MGRRFCVPFGEGRLRHVCMAKHSYEAWCGKKVFNGGMGNVAVCRQKEFGQVMAAVFLLDVYCLGAKNCFVCRFMRSEKREMLDKIFSIEGRSEMSPACAKKLVLDAVAYARNLGLEPHPDYARAANLLNPIDASQCETAFTFGQEGKPFYIQGPHDSRAFVRHVLTALHRRQGEGNYHFLLTTEMTDILEDLPRRGARV